MSDARLKVCSVVGARPQFIKAAAITLALRTVAHEVLIHTGQHYDDAMSSVFFEQLDIPFPDYNLEVGSSSHGAQTGRMLEQLEAVFEKERPDRVLVFGDTNSTLAGALAAAKLRIPVAHVEAGLRSFNRAMPEEINRVLTDHVSDLLFCPSQVAEKNLAVEGIRNGVHVVGDVMHAALEFGVERARKVSTILARLNLKERQYLLVTVHRAENTDDDARLRSILAALNDISDPIVFPVHPRTKRAIERVGWMPRPHVQLIPPASYIDMCALESHARLILTDSGGVQKEAYWLGVPCLTLRDETEWIETVEAGWNQLVGAVGERIREAVESHQQPSGSPVLYAESHAVRSIVELLEPIERRSGG